MAPRRRAAVAARRDKENRTPTKAQRLPRSSSPGRGSIGKARTPTPRRTRRSRTLPAARRSYFEGRVLALNCHDDQASAENSLKGRTSTNHSLPMADALAADYVCDDSLSDAELGARMKAVLYNLKAVPNPAEVDGRGHLEMGREPAIHCSFRHSQCQRGLAQSEVSPDSRDGFQPSLKALVLDLAAMLAVERYLRHQDGAVRLLVACILAEVLRIRAPEPPLPMAKLRPVASLFIDELLPLASWSMKLDAATVADTMHQMNDDVLVFAKFDEKAFRFGLLEQLAMVKAFVIFSEEQGVVADLFAASYSVVQPEHPQKLIALFASILTSVLEETDELSQDVLDVALAPLIPANGYQTHAVALASSVVAASSNALQVPLCNFFNFVLRSDEDESSLGNRNALDEATETSEASQAAEKSSLVPGVESLLISVNRVAPEILIYVIPNFERDLRSGDGDCRLRCVRRLCSLFSASSEMVRSYPSLFADFVGRHRDAEPEIRVEVCKAVGKLLQQHPSRIYGSAGLMSCLRDRILDQEERVRLAAIDAVTAILSSATIADSVHMLEEEVLRLVSERLKDRKPCVRQAALTTLIFAYQALSRNQLPMLQPVASAPSASGRDSTDHSDVKGLPPRLAEPAEGKPVSRSRVSWIPICLLQAYKVLVNVKDSETVLKIELALFEQLHVRGCLNKICSNFNTGSRSATCGTKNDRDAQWKSFSLMLGDLDSRSLETLVSIVAQRRRVRSLVLRIVKYRLSSLLLVERAADDAAPLESVETYVSQLASMLDIRIGSESCQSLAKQFAAFVDLNVFKKLAVALDTHSSQEEVSEASQDALARVGSKTVLAQFLRTVILPKCRAGIFCSDFIGESLRTCSKICTSVVEEGDATASGLFESEGNISMANGLLRFLELALVGAPTAFEAVGSVSKHSSRKPRKPLAMDIVAEVITGSADSSSDFAIGATSGDERQWHSDDQGRAQSSNTPLQLFRFDLLLCCLKIAHVLGRLLGDRGEAVAGACTRLAISRCADPAHCVQRAKWACRVLIVLNGIAVGDVPKYSHLVDSVTSQIDCFTGNLEDVLAPLATLTQLGQRAEPVFRKLSLAAFEFSRALLMGSMNAKVHISISEQLKYGSLNPQTPSRGSGGTEVQQARIRAGRRVSDRPSDSRRSNSSNSSSCVAAMFALATRTLAEAIRRASKLLVVSLQYVDTAESEVCGIVASFVSVATEKNGNVFGLSDASIAMETFASDEPNTFSILSDDDGPGAEALDAVADMCGAARLAAGCSIVRIACEPRFAKKIAPAQYLAVVLCAQDEHPDTRILFARKVVKYITKKRLHLRWVVALALMAIDPDKDNLREVRQLLNTVVRHRRRMQISHDTKQLPVGGKRSILRLSPEVVLPEVIWVIGNHPDAEVDSANGYVESERYLEFFLDRLLESQEFASILNQYLSSIAMASKYCLDLGSKSKRTESFIGPGERGPSSQRICDLARIGTSLLRKKQAGRKWNLVDQPGRIPLPSDLFAIPSRGATLTDPTVGPMVDVAKRFDQDNVSARKSAEIGPLVRYDRAR